MYHGERFNAWTHLLGAIAAFIGGIWLVVLASLDGSPWKIVSVAIYGFTLLVLYSASTVYHSVRGRKKAIMQKVDHFSIYLLIAGSYTPFGLIIIQGTLGQYLLTAVWAFAVVGILAKLILHDRFPAVSVVSYLVMGWLGIFAVRPLLDAIGPNAIALIVAGGIAYSLGVVFFPWKSIRHHHAIFHIFVLLGSILHYAAVVLYVVPYSRSL